MFKYLNHYQALRDDLGHVFKYLNRYQALRDDLEHVFKYLNHYQALRDDLEHVFEYLNHYQALRDDLDEIHFKFTACKLKLDKAEKAARSYKKKYEDAKERYDIT